MIRFRIVGSGYLDLPADFDFSFQYNNSVFAFENMQLSRSGEFITPRTPANDAILEFSHDVAKDGEFIRKRKSAELHAPGIKIPGFLYFGKYSNGGYSTIFVYGELTALKRINESGAISNYIAPTDALTAVASSITSAYFADGLLADKFKFYNYINGISAADKLVTGVNLSPTVKLSYLLSEAATATGLTVDTTTIGAAKDAIGVVLSGNNASPDLTDVTISGAPDNNLSFTGGTGYFNFGTAKMKYKPQGSLFWKTKEVNVLVAKRDLKVKFNSFNGVAAATGDGKFYTKNTIYYYPDNFSICEEFPLKQGEYFTVVDLDDFYLWKITSYSTSVFATIKVYSGDAGTVDVGETYYLKPNLPDITIIDILKIYANLFRCGLIYDSSTNTVSFFNFSFDKSSAMALDDILIEVSEVERSFLDYCQKNKIDFKSEEYVVNRFSLNYLINNDNLQADKTLYTIPFSDGIQTTDSNVQINDFELVAPFKKTAKQSTLAVASKTNGQTYLKHISMLYRNFSIPDNLTSIIANSTTATFKVRMDAKTFLDISNTDTFKYRGVYFCCIEGKYSNGVANLTLIKI